MNWKNLGRNEYKDIFDWFDIYLDKRNSWYELVLICYLSRYNFKAIPKKKTLPIPYNVNDLSW